MEEGSHSIACFIVYSKRDLSHFSIQFATFVDEILSWIRRAMGERAPWYPTPR